jgi:hypothetical protein
MKNYAPIEVIVPQPWRIVGLLCVFMFLLCIFFFIWQLFISSEPPDEEFIGVRQPTSSILVFDDHPLIFDGIRLQLGHLYDLHYAATGAQYGQN